MLISVLLTARANTEELKLVRDDFITGGFSHFGSQLVKLIHFGIDDALALRADQMWVRVGLVAIVSIAAVSKTDLENLTELFQQGDRLVDRRQAGGREVYPNLLVDPFDARVLVTVKKRLEDGDTLWSNSKLALSQLVENFIQSVLWIFHFVTKFIFARTENDSP